MLSDGQDLAVSGRIVRDRKGAGMAGFVLELLPPDEGDLHPDVRIGHLFVGAAIASQIEGTSRNICGSRLVGVFISPEDSDLVCQAEPFNPERFFEINH